MTKNNNRVTVASLNDRINNLESSINTINTQIEKLSELLAKSISQSATQTAPAPVAKATVKVRKASQPKAEKKTYSDIVADLKVSDSDHVVVGKGMPYPAFLILRSRMEEQGFQFEGRKTFRCSGKAAARLKKVDVLIKNEDIAKHVEVYYASKSSQPKAERKVTSSVGTGKRLSARVKKVTA